jgi:hypothetical protein
MASSSASASLDRAIIELRRANVTWRDMSRQLSRSIGSLRSRFDVLSKQSKQSTTKSSCARFTRQDDARLVDGVRRFGRNWRRISVECFASQRSSHALQHRCKRLLRDKNEDIAFALETSRGVKVRTLTPKGGERAFTPEEDAKLLDAMISGADWKQASRVAFDSQRSRFSLRNRCNRLTDSLRAANAQSPGPAARTAEFEDLFDDF